MRRPVYFDSHATTPVDPRVLEAMLPFFTEHFGNASSTAHEFGLAAADAVDGVRRGVAEGLGAEPREIVFTSGATESNNLALRGVAEALKKRGNHIVTCATEHHAVLDPLVRLDRHGFDVTVLPVEPDGRLDSERLREAIRDETILVSVMFANNEIGVLHDVAAIGAVCAERGILFHTDATQAVGKVPIDVRALGIHLLSLSAHKLYGPKGVGALYVRRSEPRVRLIPQIEGGGQERGIRSGTLNVPGIVGLGKALEVALEDLPEESVRLAGLRDRLRERLLAELDEVVENGSVEHRLPHSLSLSFGYVEGGALVNALREDLAISTGSACSSEDPEPSHVLTALGRSRELARATLRFGLTRFTTIEEVDFAAQRVVDAVRRLRSHSPLYEMRER
ncbi:aminotransferase class V-fold PLP-dependent enzyme [bacterium]|nr:aminotransferase class V-fold PLP-dependent enzyme [bacterium]